MENPEKSQNKGEGRTRQKAADAIGRHSAVFWWMNAVDEGFFRIILP